MSKPFVDRRELEAGAQRAALEDLRRRREAGEPITARVAEIAETLGCSSRTVWRRLAVPPLPPADAASAEIAPKGTAYSWSWIPSAAYRRAGRVQLPARR